MTQAMKGRKIQYRIFGRRTGTDKVYRHGSHHIEEKAVLRLMTLRLKVQDHERGVTKERASYTDSFFKKLSLPDDILWIEDREGNDVTQKLLSEFVHGKTRRNRHVVWATEEILLQERQEK